MSRAPSLKFGWNCISLGSAPGSPWTKPLNGKRLDIRWCSSRRYNNYKMQPHRKIQTTAKAQTWGWFWSWTRLWLQAGQLPADHLRTEQTNYSNFKVTVMEYWLGWSGGDLWEALQVSLRSGPKPEPGSPHQHWQTNETRVSDLKWLLLELRQFSDSSYMMSPSTVSKVVSDRSATTTAAWGPFDVPVGTPAEWHHQHHHTGQPT